MILCEPRVLFPAAGAVILSGGPVTAGILAGSIALGSLTAALLSGGTRRVRHQGRATMIATTIYGAAVLMFGVVLMLATWAGHVPGEGSSLFAIIPATTFLALAGAADNATVIFRSAILQAAVPDHLRGRVQGLFTVVVTTGPRLGDLFAGAMTLIVATWVPPALGGAILISLILWASRTLHGFLAYDAQSPTP